MKLVLESQKSKMMAVLLMVFAVLFSVFSPISEAHSKADKTKTKILSGMQKERFLNLAEQSDVFKTVTANAKFDTDSLVQEVKTKNNNFYSKLVIISGLEKENNFNQFQVFIDPKTKKVVRVIIMNLTGEEPNDTFAYYDYDELAVLRVEASGTVEDMENGNVEFVEKVESGGISIQAVPDKYIYWACRFSGFLACQTATLACGPAKFLCNLACSYAFKKAACDRYKK